MHTETHPDPNVAFHVKTRMIHGYAALMRGDLDDAEHAFRTAAREVPKSPVPQILLSTLHIARRDVPQALRSLRQLCRRHPSNALARAHLAEAYALNGQARKAEQHLEVLQTLDASTEVREFARALAEWIASPSD